MKKNEIAINSINAAEDTFMESVKEYNILQKFKSRISSEEYQLKNSILGSKLALACEYYLKGLSIPNIHIDIPSELENKISDLTEDEEVLLITANDYTEIRKNQKFKDLSNKELRFIDEKVI